MFLYLFVSKVITNNWNKEILKQSCKDTQYNGSTLKKTNLPPLMRVLIQYVEDLLFTKENYFVPIVWWQNCTLFDIEYHMMSNTSHFHHQTTSTKMKCIWSSLYNIKVILHRIQDRMDKMTLNQPLFWCISLFSCGCILSLKGYISSA